MELKRKFVCGAVIGIVSTSVFVLSAQESKSQWDGIYTDAQAKRGEAVYMKRCAVCHLDSLLGTPEDLYNPAPDLVSASFTKKWNNKPLNDLVGKIQETMPQDDPGTLSAQESADIVSLILQKGKYPAGTAELPAQAESLTAIKFLAKKPGT